RPPDHIASSTSVWERYPFATKPPSESNLLYKFANTAVANSGSPQTCSSNKISVGSLSSQFLQDPMLNNKMTCTVYIIIFFINSFLNCSVHSQVNHSLSRVIKATWLSSFRIYPKSFHIIN